MISDNDVYKIGTLTRTHGVRGELAFQFTDDIWDRVVQTTFSCDSTDCLCPSSSKNGASARIPSPC